MSQSPHRPANALIWAAIIVLLLAGFMATYLPKLREAKSLRTEKYRLDQQLHEQELESRRLRAKQEALRNDPKAVERTAREKLGVAKPGETIFRFEPENNAPPR